jgi:hypothetical protein
MHLHPPQETEETEPLRSYTSYNNTRFVKYYKVPYLLSSSEFYLVKKFPSLYVLASGHIYLSFDHIHILYVGCSRGNVLVKSLCYKPESRGFESRWGEWIYLILPVALGPGVHSAEMSTRGRKIMFLRSRARPVRRADCFTAISEPID